MCRVVFEDELISLDFLFPASHRSERRGRRPLGPGELRLGGRPHRGLQAQTGSAGTGRDRNQTHPVVLCVCVCFVALL